MSEPTEKKTPETQDTNQEQSEEINATELNEVSGGMRIIE